MPSLRTRIGVAVLLVLVGVLGHRLWSRGLGLRLGAPASKVSGPHQTEAQWAAATVIADVAAMLRYARDPRSEARDVAVDVQPSAGGFLARLTIDGRASQVAIDGRLGVWSAAAYAPAAAQLLRELPVHRHHAVATGDRAAGGPASAPPVVRRPSRARAGRPP